MYVCVCVGGGVTKYTRSLEVVEWRGDGETMTKWRHLWGSTEVQAPSMNTRNGILAVNRKLVEAITL